MRGLEADFSARSSAPRARARAHPGLPDAASSAAPAKPNLRVDTRRASPAHDAALRPNPAEACSDADKNGRRPRLSGARGHQAADEVSGHRPATTNTADVAAHRDGSTRSGPWQRALRPARSPFCEQILLGRRMAPRADVSRLNSWLHSLSPSRFFSCLEFLL